MKKVVIAFATAFLLLGSALAFKAQKRSLELSEMSNKVEASIMRKMPGWRREAIAPMSAGGVVNDQIAIDQWTDGDRVVKVSIVRYESEERAKEVLSLHANTEIKNPVKDLGDEAYMLNGSEFIGFRKQNLIISVAEIGQVLPKKHSVLAKRFAQYVADVLAEPKK